MTLYSLRRVAQLRRFRIVVTITMLCIVWVAWAVLRSACITCAHFKLQTNSDIKTHSANISINSPDKDTVKFAHKPDYKHYSKLSEPHLNSFVDYPWKYLNSKRFDVIVKLVYAFYYSVHKFVPDTFVHAYTEHVRVWVNFTEPCWALDPKWFDFNAPCKGKTISSDYISNFHNTIDSLKERGFESNTSRIPINRDGVILNGAHRLATTIILSKTATFQYLDTATLRKPKGFNYLFFERKGLKRNISDSVMLEWMKIQLKLPNVSTKVFTLTVFSESRNKDSIVRNIVSRNCSKDNGILYEKIISVTKLGMIHLMRHMHGNHYRISEKIGEMLSLFKGPEFTVVSIFFFGKHIDDMKNCTRAVRKLFNYQRFESSAYLPNSAEECFILAQMILNPNSILFLNHAINGLDCLGIAKELGKRMSLQPMTTDLYIGREDFMIDTGAVRHFFNLQNRTNVDILFFDDIDKRVPGNKNGFDIEPRVFKGGRFGETVKSKWDMFYDSRNFGYCYGIKFVSLDLLAKLTLQSSIATIDQGDVSLIQKFVKMQNLQHLQ